MDWREKAWVQGQEPKYKILKLQLEQGIESSATWSILYQETELLVFFMFQWIQISFFKIKQLHLHEIIMSQCIQFIIFSGGGVLALSREEIVFSSFQSSYHLSSWLFCGKPLLFLSFCCYSLKNEGHSPSLLRDQASIYGFSVLNTRCLTQYC